jgi:hypothetical protein
MEPWKIAHAMRDAVHFCFSLGSRFGRFSSNM